MIYTPTDLDDAAAAALARAYLVTTDGGAPTMRRPDFADDTRVATALVAAGLLDRVGERAPVGYRLTSQGRALGRRVAELDAIRHDVEAVLTRARKLCPGDAWDDLRHAVGRWGVAARRRIGLDRGLVEYTVTVPPITSAAEEP